MFFNIFVLNTYSTFFAVDSQDKLYCDSGPSSSLLWSNCKIVRIKIFKKKEQKEKASKVRNGTHNRWVILLGFYYLLVMLNWFGTRLCIWGEERLKDYLQGLSDDSYVSAVRWDK